MEVLKYGHHTQRPSCRPDNTCPRRNHPLVRLLLSLLLLTTTTTLAKPMPSPSLETAVRQSVAIVEVEYLGYDNGKVSYFSGPLANYRLVRTLKGKSPKQIKVRYDFTDGSACLAPKPWSFSPKMMPRTGSRWILLLQTQDSPSTTYRGTFGRQKSGPNNLKKIQNHLRSSK